LEDSDDEDSDLVVVESNPSETSKDGAEADNHEGEGVEEIRGSPSHPPEDEAPIPPSKQEQEPEIPVPRTRGHIKHPSEDWDDDVPVPGSFSRRNHKDLMNVDSGEGGPGWIDWFKRLTLRPAAAA
jgi:hypothetical protein